MTRTLSERLDGLLTAFGEAHGRFTTRLESASEEEARRPRDGSWTPAQIGVHVATFDTLISRIVSGAVPGAADPPPGFVERAWPEIEMTLHGRLEAPSALQPPPDVGKADALSALTRAAAEVTAAFRALDTARAALTFTHPRVGTVRMAHLGDWIVAHTIRHNAQLKRVLGR